MLRLAGGDALSRARAQADRRRDAIRRRRRSASSIVSALLGPIVLLRGVAHPRLATAYVIVGLLGGIILYVVGFFYKIVPLLAWTVRYRDRMAGAPAPTIAQTFSAASHTCSSCSMTLGVTLLASGTGAGSVHVVRCGAVLFLAGVVLLVTQVYRVAVGRAA